MNMPRRRTLKCLLSVAVLACASAVAGCDEDDYGWSYSNYAFGFDFLPSFGGIGDYFESTYEYLDGWFGGDGGYFDGYEESYEEGYWWEEDWKRKNAGRRK